MASHALTRELILARCKTDNLKLLKNLNLWGVGFDDVSILSQMPNIEVLALSINKISTLKDFQHCGKLQELYIRRNNIKNLAEIKYLQNLPHLKTLWLSENPCADHPNYRQYVLSVLPNLQKLDNKEVTSDERQKALGASPQVLHPEGENVYRYSSLTREQPRPQTSAANQRAKNSELERYDDYVAQSRHLDAEERLPSSQRHGRVSIGVSPHHQAEDGEDIRYDSKFAENPSQRNSNFNRDLPNKRPTSTGSQLHPIDANRPPVRHDRYEEVAGGKPKVNNFTRDAPRQAPPVQPAAIKKKEHVVEVVSKPQKPTQDKFVKNENIMSAILCLMKDLNADELMFLKREADVRIGSGS